MDDAEAAAIAEEMMVQAMRIVIDSNDFVRLDEIARFANVSPGFENQVLEWKRDRRIFSITFRGTALFPVYGFAPMLFG